jgi:hypothetical protein
LRRAALGLVALALGGCSSFEVRRGEALPSEQLDFEIGVAERGAVLDALGPPLRVAALGDGVAFLYEEVVTRETQIGVSLDALNLGFLKAVVARGEADRKAVLAVFDADGVLRALAQDAWREDLGAGGALQLLWVAVPLSDAAELEVDPPAVHWPAHLLAEVPVALNRVQSLDGGAAGLEQVATPREVGQHALELR